MRQGYRGRGPRLVSPRLSSGRAACSLSRAHRRSSASSPACSRGCSASAARSSRRPRSGRSARRRSRPSAPRCRRSSRRRSADRCATTARASSAGRVVLWTSLVRRAGRRSAARCSSRVGARRRPPAHARDRRPRRRSPRYRTAFPSAADGRRVDARGALRRRGGGSRSSASAAGVLSRPARRRRRHPDGARVLGWVGLPLKEAVATSLACVGILAIPGTITHALLGDIDWAFAIPLCVGVIPGARSARTSRSGRPTARCGSRSAIVLGDHRGRSTRSARSSRCSTSGSSSARARRTPRRASAR